MHINDAIPAFQNAIMSHDCIQFCGTVLSCHNSADFKTSEMFSRPLSYCQIQKAAAHSVDLPYSIDARAVNMI